ncbi:MAG TPA: alpha/beta hydrolase [Mycobacteriales bacterium]|nr:alpha/beta hydrolase [Mycobacteriales bacterium]
MTRFTVTSSDGTAVAGWRNNGDGPPVLICNGLGTPPVAWPILIAPERGFRVASWYYRGTGGGERPTDPERITVDDHVQDALAVMDAEGMDKPLLACWSLGVNVGFELARQHPDRVAGLLAVAGLPGGTFSSIGGRIGVPRPFRYGLGATGAKVLRRFGKQMSWTARHIPVNRVTATVINHSGIVLPAARPEWLMPMLEEFREHDFGWYFTLALAGAKHEPMDLEFVTAPVTLVAGQHDVITSSKDMVEAASHIPHAQLRVLPGSHFLPLEYPVELADEMDSLAARAGLRPPSLEESEHPASKTSR